MSKHTIEQEIAAIQDEQTRSILHRMNHRIDALAIRTAVFKKDQAYDVFQNQANRLTGKEAV